MNECWTFAWNYLLLTFCNAHKPKQISIEFNSSLNNREIVSFHDITIINNNVTMVMIIIVLASVIIIFFLYNLNSSTFGICIYPNSQGDQRKFPSFAGMIRFWLCLKKYFGTHQDLSMMIVCTFTFFTFVKAL